MIDLKTSSVLMKLQVELLVILHSILMKVCIKKAKYFHEHKNIDVIDASEGLSDAYQKALKMTKTGYFWAISNDCRIETRFQ